MPVGTAEFVDLFDLPHREARRLITTGVPVYLGVDPVEYHGPHLSLHNDRAISTAFARDMHARVRRVHPEGAGWPCVVGANLEVGFEPAPGPGSREVSFATLTELVSSAARSLAALGAQRLVIVTFHGSPLHAIALQRGVDAFVAAGGRALSPMNILLRELTALDTAPLTVAYQHIPEPDRTAMLQSLALDFHAGFSETSIALHYAPEGVDACHRGLPDCPSFECVPAFARASRVAKAAGRAQFARELYFVGCGLAWSKLRPFPGYTGSPRYATAAAGAVFAEALVSRAARAALDVFAGGTPPRPVMRWLEAATLQGRLPGMAVPLEALVQYDGAAASA